MEKDQNLNTNNLSEKENSKPDKDSSTEKTHSMNKKEQKQKDISPEEKISELEDKLTRTLAEMENQRRRFEKEKDEAFDYGGFIFARESLNLIDNLERAKESLKNDETLKDSEALKKTLNNLEIINKDLISIFKKNNIEPIVSISEKLDPNFHQAMLEIEDDEKEPGTIIQEIQKGFMMKDRLLRPSLVAVSKKPEKKDDDDKQDKKNKQNQDKSTNK